MAAYLLTCPSYRRWPSQAPELYSVVFGWPSASSPLDLRKLSVQNRPSCAHTSHVENHLVLDLLCLVLPLFARFIMSFVSSLFSWLIFRYHLVNRKPIDKTTESIIIFHLLHTSHKTTQVEKSWRNTNSDPHHDFTPAGIGLALFVCCSNSLLYTHLFGDPPGRPMYRVSNYRYSCAHMLSARERCSYNRESVRMHCWYTSISFVDVTLFASGSTFKFIVVINSQVNPAHVMWRYQLTSCR